jgi:hypothetical protein
VKNSFFSDLKSYLDQSLGVVRVCHIVIFDFGLLVCIIREFSKVVMFLVEIFSNRTLCYLLFLSLD